MNILDTLRDRLRRALRPVCDDPEPFVAMLRVAQDPRFGDYQANCAMPLAKQVGKNPRDVAAELVDRLDVSDLCEPLEVAGPGFINFRVRQDWLEDATSRLIHDERMGVEPVSKPETVVVDFSGPNVAKPMHVGHLRSTVIGDALSRLLSFLGHKVIRDSHIGDWGTQFGMIIYGYKHFRDDQAYGQSPVEELARLYRLVNQLCDYHDAVAALPQLGQQLDQTRSQLADVESAVQGGDKSQKKVAKKLRADVAGQEKAVADAKRKRDAVQSDPALQELADAHPQIATDSRKETAKLHAGDEQNRRLWEQFLPECLTALEALYDRMEIRFDVPLREGGESDYQPMLGQVVEDLLAKGIATDSNGAVCVFIEGNEAPFLVRKTDGAFTYATTDLATIQRRVEEFGAQRVLYVVDARQSEHFHLLFETALRAGFDGTAFHHVSFGTVLGEDRTPFKTRSGDTVGLESLLDEAVTCARGIIDENDDKKDQPELDDATRTRIAEIVGIGGIKYADLRHNRESDYVFSWDKMLATTGDTATYMQYSYARICGIFRKGGVERDALRQPDARVSLPHPEERNLALQLNRLSEALHAASREFRPNILTQYLFDTAKAYTALFEKHPVLKAESDELRTSRLLLCDLTGRVIKQGLDLLGIHTAERM